ncbi:hypothetical protein VTN96DRAFT_6255 [Rasamsonia emersonii]
MISRHPQSGRLLRHFPTVLRRWSCPSNPRVLIGQSPRLWGLRPSAVGYATASGKLRISTTYPVWLYCNEMDYDKTGIFFCDCYLPT